MAAPDDKDKNRLRSIADAYAATKGLSISHGLPPVKADPERGARIAQAFEAMPHQPDHPEVKSAYNALANETLDQYRHLKNNGLQISRIAEGQQNPYKSSKDVHEDVRNNNHLWYYPTTSGFGGTDASAQTHPLLAPTPETHDGKPLLANDLFRIVHDVFGHAKEGSGFGPSGEENAWREHMQMYSPEAQKAMTTETRGQNSWVNYGPKGIENRANPKETVYAEQKAGIMPEWTRQSGAPMDVQERNKRAKEMGFDPDTTWYHGTKADIGGFDPAALGASTGAPSAKQGYFFTKDAETAGDYSRLSSEREEIKAKRDQAGIIQNYMDGLNAMQKRFGTGWEKKRQQYHDWLPHDGHERAADISGFDPKDPVAQKFFDTEEAYDNAKENSPSAKGNQAKMQAYQTAMRTDPKANAILNKTKELQNYVDTHHDKNKAWADQSWEFQNAVGKIKDLEQEQIQRSNELMSVLEARGSNVIPANLNMQNPLVHDFKGESYRDESYNDLIKKAKANGHDSVLLKNTYDPAGKTRNKIDVAVVFEPHQIRSKFAKFNPKEKEKGGLHLAEGGEVGGLPEAGNVNDQLQAAVNAPPILDTQSSPNQAPMDTSPSGPVNVINPQGNLVSIPGEQLQDALQAGYQQATQDHIDAYTKQQKYGTPGQQAIAGLEGAASSATFGLSTGAERLAGVDPEGILGRKEANPWAHGAGAVAGLIGPGVLGAAGKALGKAGAAVAEAVGLGAPATTIAKIGSLAVKGAVENGLYQSGDEVSKMLASDPNQSVQTAAANIGLGGLMGGAIGGTVGAAAPLWRLSGGPKVAGVLKAMVGKTGGIEGQAADPINSVIQATGLDIDPVIKASLGSDPKVRQMFQTLQDSATGSGLKAQEALNNFRSQLSDHVTNVLGRTPEEVNGLSDLSKYEAGKSIGNTLADEYAAQVNPLSAEYDALHAKYQGVDLDPSVADKAEETSAALDKANGNLQKVSRAAQKAQAGGDPGAAIEAAAKVSDAQAELKAIQDRGNTPGTTDLAAEKISQLADREGWNTSPSSDIMKNVNQVMRELPLQKTVKNLSDYISQIGNNMQADPLNGPLTRAGGMIKGILRDYETDIIGRKIGSEEGEDALTRYAGVRQAYRQQAELKEAIDSRLHAKGSTAGYAKSIRQMAQTDGESVLRRLSGTGDADILNVLQKSYPKTAALVRQYHLDNALGNAASKAAPGETLNTRNLLNSIEKMSPEIRNFALSPEAQSGLSNVQKLLEALPEKIGKSGTPQGLDALMAHIPGTAAGMVTMLLGHNPATALIVGQLTKYLGRDFPDAVRLATLKFLGSGQAIDAPAFKTAVEHIQATMNGENMLSKAAKNVFKAEKEVIPESQMSTQKDRDRLEKQLKEVQSDPKSLLDAGGDTGHYLPNQAQAIGQTAAQASAFLNSIRPGTVQNAPLDTPKPPTAMDKAAYNKALDIAVQPLSVLNKVKAGTLTSQEVTALKSMYPALYDRMSQKLTSEMTEALTKGAQVPYKTRVGLSLFMGQPLDSTMTPEAIMAAQPAPKAPPAPSPTKNKKSTSNLSKLPSQFETQGQAAEADSIKRGSK